MLVDLIMPFAYMLIQVFLIIGKLVALLTLDINLSMVYFYVILQVSLTIGKIITLLTLESCMTLLFMSIKFIQQFKLSSTAVTLLLIQSYPPDILMKIFRF